MNLGRIGHYFVPNSGPEEAVVGSCQTAIVVRVADDGGLVNLVVWEQDGDSDERLGVEHTHPSTGRASFHLNADCPWSR